MEYIPIKLNFKNDTIVFDDLELTLNLQIYNAPKISEIYFLFTIFFKFKGDHI